MSLLYLKRPLSCLYKPEEQIRIQAKITSLQERIQNITLNQLFQTNSSRKIDSKTWVQKNEQVVVIKLADTNEDAHQFPIMGLAITDTQDINDFLENRQRFSEHSKYIQMIIAACVITSYTCRILSICVSFPLLCTSRFLFPGNAKKSFLFTPLFIIGWLIGPLLRKVIESVVYRYYMEFDIVDLMENQYKGLQNCENGLLKIIQEKKQITEKDLTTVFNERKEILEKYSSLLDQANKFIVQTSEWACHIDENIPELATRVFGF